MAYDKFLIGFNDGKSGFQSNVKPWLYFDNGFETLEDMYVIRGVVKKRFGSIFMGGDQTGSRLRVKIGTTDSMTGDLTVMSGDFPGTVYEIGQMFSCGSDIYTVWETGTPGDCLSTSTATATFDTSSGEFILTGGPLTEDVYFYPATPVMGLSEFYIESSGAFDNLAFDTQFSYRFDRTDQSWDRLSSGDSIWTGSDSDFFWSCSYQGAVASLDTLWTTNFNIPDGIRYWDNSTWTKPIINYTIGDQINTTDGSGNQSGNVPDMSGSIGQVFYIGTTFYRVVIPNGALEPISYELAGSVGTGTFDISNGAYTFSGATVLAPIYFSGNNYVETARIIVSFKNRLVLLNTVENIGGVSQNFPFRARYSAIGSPLAVAAWMGDIPGNGDAVDAQTQQAIVTAQFVKDRLIVSFDSSSYELVYTNNEVIPFIWQKINAELGAVSTFSEIPFDKVVIGIDDNGIHACNGTNVERIDQKIPQYPFDISNQNNGNDRVAGIRDYFNEMAYWTIVPTNRNDSFYFPNTVLVYNYINDSWAKINDSFTTWGYFLLPPETSGLTWGQTTTPWGQNTNLWNKSGDSTNNTTIKSVIMGNQQGYVRVVRPNISSNAASLQVTNFTYTSPGQGTITCPNHNLSGDQFILLQDMNGITFSSGDGMITLPQIICRVTPDPVTEETPDSFSFSALDNQSLPVIIAGNYVGGGTISLVSNINILSKQYNFYTKSDRNMAVSKIEFMVDKTTNGQVIVDYLVSSTGLSLLSEGIGNSFSPGPLPGNGTLETTPYLLAPLEKFQQRLWHPVYLYADGECIQIQIYMSIDQMFNYTIVEGKFDYTALNDFQLHAMIFCTTPTSYGLQ